MHNAKLITCAVAVATLAGCGAGTVQKAVWERYFTGAAAGESRIDWVYALDVDSYGNVIAAGTTIQTGDSRKEDILIASHNASGAVNWIKNVDLPKAGFDSLESTTDAVVDESGNTYIVGNATRISQTDNSQTENAGFLVKVDSYGSTVWSRTFSGEEVIRDVEYQNGLVYLGGSKTRVYSVDGVKNLEIDHAGAMVWDVNVDALGNIYGCGGNFTAKFSPNGVMQWRVNNPAEVNQHCTVSVTQYGEAYVAHEIYFADQLRVAKINESGVTVWAKNLAEPTSNAGSLTGLPLVTEAADGSVYAVSSTVDGRKLYKLDPAGNTLWSKSSTDSVVRTLHVDSAGNVYLYGRGRGEKFDATGKSIAKIVAPYTAEVITGDALVVNNVIYAADTLNKNGTFTGWLAKYSNP